MIFLGSTDGRIHVWRTVDGEKLTTFTTDNSSDCIQCVQFNPKSFMLATASANMVRDNKTKKKDFKEIIYFILSFRYFGCHLSMMIKINNLIIRFFFFFSFSYLCAILSYYIIVQCKIFVLLLV
jgi:WD40 repeat protein